MAVQTQQGYGPGTPQFDNLNPTLQRIAMQVVAESGGRVWIGSGWRSGQQQTALYNAWKNGTYDVPVVAKPGHSQHERGGAIDFDGDLQLAQQIGRRLGLVFPVEGEAWHAQLGEGVAETGTNVQYDLGYEGTEVQEDPEAVLANRMHAIQRMLGGSAVNSMMGNAMMDGTDEDDLMSDAQPMELNFDAQTGMGSAQVADPTKYGTVAQSMFQEFGFGQEDFPALVELWNRESGDPQAGSQRVTWNPLAQNPNSTAFGIAQFLNGTWKGTGFQKTTDPVTQIRAGLTYIKSRHGNPRNALAFHNQNNWY